MAAFAQHATALRTPLFNGLHNVYSEFTVPRLPLGVAINLRPSPPLPTLDVIDQLNRLAGEMP